MIEGSRSLDLTQKIQRFSIPQVADYKNPAMLALEPEYLRSTDYNPGNMTPIQWSRKISELAFRLGKMIKKGPEPLDTETGLRILQALAGVAQNLEETAVVFYENDPAQPTHLEKFTDVNLDFSPVLEDAIEFIEQKGINLQQEKEDVLLRDGKLPAEDQSRVRQISLRNNLAHENVPVVAKRVRLARVSKDPFEELYIMKKIQSFGLPGVRPIASLRARGNYYLLMEKVSGLNFKQILKKPQLLVEVMGKDFNPERTQEYLEQIRQEALSVETVYKDAGISRRGFQEDTQDLIISYDQNLKKWNVVPIDFEKAK